MNAAVLYAVSLLLLAAALASARQVRRATTTGDYATWLAITGASVWCWTVTAVIAGRLA